jgi:release factor glutamine methyltransferase
MSTIAEALRDGRNRLAAKGIATASLDARLLLQAAAKIQHEDIIAWPERELPVIVLHEFESLIARRELFEPVSKILGVKEFYGRPFVVTRDVLDPRPDTESVVELALRHVRRDQRIRILDLGSGSGALICTLLAELSLASGEAVDVSAAAREITIANAAALGLADRLTVHDGPWFNRLTGRFDLVVSNPPYIPRGDVAQLAPDVREHDPHMALDGGADGLDCYRAIAADVGQYLEAHACIVVELGTGQLSEVRQIFAEHKLKLLDQCLDLSGQVRAAAFVMDYS